MTFETKLKLRRWWHGLWRGHGPWGFARSHVKGDNAGQPSRDCLPCGHVEPCAEHGWNLPGFNRTPSFNAGAIHDPH